MDYYTSDKLHVHMLSGLERTVKTLMSLTMMKTTSIPHHCITVIAVWRRSWKSEPGSCSGIDFNTAFIDSPSSFPLDGFRVAIIQDISLVYHRKRSVFDEFLEPGGIDSTSEYTSGAEPTQKALWSDENFQKKKKKTGGSNHLYEICYFSFQGCLSEQHFICYKRNWGLIRLQIVFFFFS